MTGRIIDTDPKYAPPTKAAGNASNPGVPDEPSIALVETLMNSGTGHVQQPTNDHTVLVDPFAKGRKGTLVEGAQTS